MTIISADVYQCLWNISYYLSLTFNTDFDNKKHHEKMIKLRPQVIYLFSLSIGRKPFWFFLISGSSDVGSLFVPPWLCILGVLLSLIWTAWSGVNIKWEEKQWKVINSYIQHTVINPRCCVMLSLLVSGRWGWCHCKSRRGSTFHSIHSTLIPRIFMNYLPCVHHWFKNLL